LVSQRGGSFLTTTTKEGEGSTPSIEKLPRPLSFSLRGRLSHALFKPSLRSCSGLFSQQQVVSKKLECATYFNNDRRTFVPHLLSNESSVSLSLRMVDVVSVA